LKASEIFFRIREILKVGCLISSRLRLRISILVSESEGKKLYCLIQDIEKTFTIHTKGVKVGIQQGTYRKNQSYKI